MTKEREIQINVHVKQNDMIRLFGTYTVVAKTQKEAIEKLKNELHLPFEIVDMIPLRAKRKNKINT